MPGMMDTVLNLGLNDKSVEGLARQTDDERFAYDSYRRFIAMYGRIVLGVAGEEFDSLLDAAKELAGTTSDARVPVELLRYLVDSYQQIVERHTGKPFPQDPDEQLRGAIEAVFASLERRRGPSPTASASGSPTTSGTAVNVQAMVFGNRDDEFGHRRRLHPRPGHGRHAATTATSWSTPRARTSWPASATPSRCAALAAPSRRSTSELLDIFARLEHHYRDMCDTEFTIEQGKLWMLQTAGRQAHRTGRPAHGRRDGRRARDQPHQGRGRGAHHRGPPRPGAPSAVRLEPGHKVLAKGLAASPGAAVGRVYLTADAA